MLILIRHCRNKFRAILKELEDERAASVNKDDDKAPAGAGASATAGIKRKRTAKNANGDEAEDASDEKERRNKNKTPRMSAPFVGLKKPTTAKPKKLVATIENADDDNKVKGNAKSAKKLAAAKMKARAVTPAPESADEADDN